MRLKRFRGRRVPEVVRQVRRELGPEAVILHTRPVRRRGLLRFLGGAGVEVVAATDEVVRRPAAPLPRVPARMPERAPARMPERAPARAPEPLAARLPQHLVERVPESDLRQAMAELRGLLVKVNGSRALHPQAAPLYERLVAAGVDEGLAFRAVSALPVFGAEDGGASGPREPALRQALAAMLTVAPLAPPRRAVQAFVGATGVGKTTTVAKLAVRSHLAGITTRMLSLDTTGLAAGAPLAALSRLLGLPYTPLADAAEAAAQQPGGPGSGLTLIDTPGLAPSDAAGIAALARLLAGLRPTETHLVLSATTKSDDARAALAAFRPLGVTHLAFTRLDETRSVGSLLGIAVDTGLPLSHFGTGRDIPNDLRPASAEELLRRIFEGDPAR